MNREIKRSSSGEVSPARKNTEEVKNSVGTKQRLEVFREKIFEEKKKRARVKKRVSE